MQELLPPGGSRDSQR